jgi:hypothetical protein
MKSKKPLEHESLAIWVSDGTTLEKYLFIVERQPSPLSTSSRLDFFGFPPSGQVMKSIEKAVLNMRSTTAAGVQALFCSKSIDTDSELIPLFPMSDLDATESASTFKTGFLDTLTSTISSVLAAARTGSQSVKPQELAEDTISGAPLESQRRDDAIRTFKPKALSLFDVALLAKVLNEYAPIYGLFSNQCYMYASVMFDAIVKVYTVPDYARYPNLPPLRDRFPLPRLRLVLLRMRICYFYPAPISRAVGRGF